MRQPPQSRSSASTHQHQIFLGVLSTQIIVNSRCISIRASHHYTFTADVWILSSIHDAIEHESILQRHLVTRATSCNAVNLRNVIFNVRVSRLAVGDLGWFSPSISVILPFSLSSHPLITKSVYRVQPPPGNSVSAGSFLFRTKTSIQGSLGGSS